MSTTYPSASSYLQAGRLSDVLALIQILAYHKLGKRSNDGLVTDLCRRPLSADTWIDLGRWHPELFRVLQAERHNSNKETVALVARFVQEPIAAPVSDEPPKLPPLTPDQTSKLMDLVVQLHDREVQRRDKWKTVTIPMVVAIIAAGASIAASVISVSKSGDKIVSAEARAPMKAAPICSQNSSVQMPGIGANTPNIAPATNSELGH